MQTLRNLSFKNKVLFSTTLIVVLVGIAFFFVVRWVLLPSLTLELKKRGVAIAQSIAGQSRSHILVRDTPMLTSLIFDARQLEERKNLISYIVILDADQQVLAHTFIGEFPPWLVEANALLPDQARSIQSVKIPEGQIYDIAVPVKEGIYQIGTVRVGLNKAVIDRLIRKLAIILLGAIFAVIVVVFFISQRLAKYITRPVTQLTRLADEISHGNLDVAFDIGETVKCWEIEKCDKTDCPAYGKTDVMCWFTEGTLCTGAPMGKFPEKLAECAKCRVYRKHAGDEIVRLSDAFANMTMNLKVSRDELRRAYDFERNLIDCSIDAIVATNDKGSIVIFNEAAEKLFGYASEDVVGKMDAAALYPPARSREARKDLMSEGYGGVGRLVNYETIIVDRSGKEVPVWLSANIMYEQEKILGTVMFLQDLTERRRLEKKVLESERLATVGLVASYISHEIKNPLTVISGFANQVFRNIDGDDKNREKLGIIIKEVNRLEGFLSDVRDFTKLSQPKKIMACINGELGEVLAFFAREFEAHHVAVEQCTDPGLPENLFDPRQIKQVFINIIKNSVEAMPDGGKLTIATQVKDDCIEIRISDTGKGIAPKDLKDIFSPFVTTKPTGTGLGLAISRKIIDDHEGEICIQSKPGQGTVCTILLPVHGSAENE